MIDQQLLQMRSQRALLVDLVFRLLHVVLQLTHGNPELLQRRRQVFVLEACTLFVLGEDRWFDGFEDGGGRWCFNPNEMRQRFVWMVVVGLGRKQMVGCIVGSSFGDENARVVVFIIGYMN